MPICLFINSLFLPISISLYLQDSKDSLKINKQYRNWSWFILISNYTEIVDWNQNLINFLSYSVSENAILVGCGMA
jgi:hypothetical protein